MIGLCDELSGLLLFIGKSTLEHSLLCEDLSVVDYLNTTMYKFYTMIRQLYTNLKQLEDSLYCQLDQDRRTHIRRLCSAIFDYSERLLRDYKFSAAQTGVLEGVRTAADTIDDTIGVAFDRVKANEWLVKPCLHDLELMAASLGVSLPREKKT